MNTLSRRLARSLSLSFLCVSLFTAARAADPSPGFVDFGKLVPSASSDQFVEVHLHGALLKLAAQVTQKNEPEVADLLSGIERVRVNVVGLGEDNRAEITQRVKHIRSELAGNGWDQIVQAKEAKSDVSVYLKSTQQEVVQGIVVTVIEGGREAVLINVVGNIRLDQLGKLGERLNLDPLKNLEGTLRQPKSERTKEAK